MNFYYFVYEYYATGEGMTKYFFICRSGSKEDAIKMFENSVPSYVIQHGQYMILTKEEMLRRNGKQLPAFVINIIESDSPPPAFLYSQSLYLNVG